MSNEQNNDQNEVIRNTIGELRAIFEARDWSGTLEMYERMRGILKVQRAARLEAACLASRAAAAQKNRSVARAILRTVAGATYSKSTHYVFLARAFLDLMQLQEAAEACQRAHALREVETMERPA